MFTVIALALIGGYSVMAALVVVNISYLRRRRTVAVEQETLPLISVLVPARNEARNLERLIPSLLSQHYPRLEIIVYDDASEDDTATVLASFDDTRLRTISGSGPPPGWVGKVHALYQATREAKGDVFVFLDADTKLVHDSVLQRLILQFLALPSPRVLSGIPRLKGGGELLVSMVLFVLVTSFPVPLAPVGRRSSLAMLAGGCWMIGRDVYLEHEPHKAHPNEVLDDIVTARYLKARGAAAHLYDFQQEVEVFMYESHSEAWKGFRKNAFLAAGSPVRFVAALSMFTILFVIAPIIWWPSILAIYLLKGMSDRFAGFSLVTTLLAPVSLAMTVALSIDSAFAHLMGTVTWKGRVVNQRGR